MVPGFRNLARTVSSFPYISNSNLNCNTMLLNLVAELRKATGLSLKMCQEAAKESNFDYSVALAKLQVRAMNSTLDCVREVGRQGLLGLFGDHRFLKLIKLRCESDFVAMNPDIVDLVAKAAVEENFLSLDTSVNYCRAKFKENICIETNTFEAENEQILGHYIHPRIRPQVGKAVGIVTLQMLRGDNVMVAAELANLLSRQLVACGNETSGLPDFLKSDYLFDPVGSVSMFIEKVTKCMNIDVQVANIVYFRI